MATLQCNVVSIDRTVFSGAINMLIATGVGGEVGILPRHTPLITLLAPGPLQMHLPDGSKELIYVESGVLEVQPDIITVLADGVKTPAEIEGDLASIEKNKQELEQQLTSSYSEKATEALAKVNGQLRALNRYRDCN